MASASNSGGGGPGGGGSWWRRRDGNRRPATVVVAAAAALGLGAGVALERARARRRDPSAAIQQPDLPLRPAGLEQSLPAAAAPPPPRPPPPAASAGVTREALGRATWTLLHTLAARFPDHPTRRQRRDAESLIDALTRVYPCGECAAHFAELCRRDPPDASSGAALRLWTCRAHNSVNQRLGKPAFDCALAAARWAPEACDGGGGKEAAATADACEMGVGAAAAAVGAAAVAEAARGGGGGRARW
jgi:FAD-linked sulfhydryl oxidase